VSVVSAVEPHITVEAPMKFVPVTVSVNGAAPATAVAGVSDVIVGALTVKVDAAEDALLEFFTVTFTVPASMSCALETAAVSEVGLPEVSVVSGVEPHITVEAPRKCVPVTVSVNGTSPATAVDGVSDAIVGPLMVKADPPEDTELEFFTLTLAVPAEASWVLVTAAVSEVALP